MGGSSDNEDFTVELDAISVVDSDEDWILPVFQRNKFVSVF